MHESAGIYGNQMGESDPLELELSSVGAGS